MFLAAESPIVLGAAVGCAWGFADALTRPVSRFRAAHVSKWGWVAVFGVLAVLIVFSDIGVRVIHAPYHLRTLNSLLLLAITGCALACICLYLVTVVLTQRSCPPG